MKIIGIFGFPAAVFLLLGGCTPAVRPVSLATPTGPTAQTWYAGGSLHSARIPAPFVPDARCVQYRAIEIDAVGGPALHISRVTAGGLDLTLEMAAIRGQERGRYSCPDGSEGALRHQTIYHGEVDGNWTQAAEIGIGYVPSTLPFRAGLGAGWIRGTGAPYATASLGIRTSTHIRGFADVALRQASVPYVRYEEQARECGPDWGCDSHPVRVEIGRGREWATGRSVRIGLEIPLARR